MTLLDDILAPQAITTVFQPIVACDRAGNRSLHGYEALTRGPRGTHASRADVLFEYVRRKHAEPVVDRACVVAALQAARSLPACPHLSLNVHAATLGQDEGFVALLLETAQANGFRPEQLVIEVVEQSSLWNSRGFAQAIAALRRAGVRLAIDDVGTGHSHLQMVVEVRPDFLKLDRFFVTGATDCAVRRAVQVAIVTLADAIGAGVVAEGIETADDLSTATAAGIRLVQGYLLSPPFALGAPPVSAPAWLTAVPLSA